MIHHAVQWLYWFGTDFCINMANLLGITYDEFNVLLFLFVLPLFVTLLITLNIIKSIQNFGCRKDGEKVVGKRGLNS